MNHDTVTYKRDVLYQEVWSEPVSTVAHRYGVSDTALAKMCRKLAIPLPGRGYWAQKHAGQEVAPRVLPALPRGTPSEISVTRPANARRVVSERVLAGLGLENAQVEFIPVAPDLVAAHKLVRAASKLLRRADEQEGRVSCHGQCCVDVVASPALLDRALRIMDALIRNLEARGLVVEVTPFVPYEARTRRSEESNPSNVTRVIVAGEPLAFGISEKCNSVRQPPPAPPKKLTGQDLETWHFWNKPRQVRVPNGVLALEIKGTEGMGCRRVWQDGKHQRIEDCLPEFIAELFVTAEVLKQARAERDARQREYEAEHRRRYDAEQRRQQDIELGRRLQALATNWRAAQEIRRFIEAVAQVTPPGTEKPAVLGVSLEWALAYADRLDPIGALRASPDDRPDDP